MSGTPNDTVGLVIFAIDAILGVISFEEGVQRLQSGLASRAEAEQRELTDEEMSLERGLLEEAERRRRGQVV